MTVTLNILVIAQIKYFPSKFTSCSVVIGITQIVRFTIVQECQNLGYNDD